MLLQVAERSPVVVVIAVYRIFYLKTFFKGEEKRSGKNSSKNYCHHIKRSNLFSPIVLVFKQEP